MLVWITILSPLCLPGEFFEVSKSFNAFVQAFLYVLDLPPFEHVFVFDSPGDTTGRCLDFFVAIKEYETSVSKEKKEKKQFIVFNFSINDDTN